ncbi:MAG: hypothetical protein ACP5IX_02575 [Patescibacteria group bacterium]
MLDQFLRTKVTSNNTRFLVTIFFLALIILILIILIEIIPSAEIVLQVNREPYIGEFRIKIDKTVKKIFYNLDIIPASIFNLSQINRDQYILINELTDRRENLALVFKYNDLNDLLNQGLGHQASIPKIVIGNIQIVNYEVEKFDLSNGQALIKLLIKTEVIPNFNLQFLKEKLANKSKLTAINYLKTMPNVQDVKINCWPGFLNKLPSANWRIKIKVVPL